MDGQDQPATGVQGMWWLTDAAVAVPGDVWMEVRDGVASGSTGCNRFRGTCEVGADGTVAFGPAATTMRACDEATMQLERRVLVALEVGGRLTSDGELRIGDPADDLVFQRVEPSAEGEWQVVAVHVPARDAIVSSGRPVVAVIADGAITVTTPSGTVAGTISSGPSPVELGPLPADAHVDDLAAVAALVGAAGWSREGRLLHFLRDDGGIAASLTS